MIDVSPDLLAFLRAEYDRCQDDELEDERTTAIDRYNGEKYGDEEPGRSQVVARDTAETVDYMVISILRTIVSGDDVVEFVHRNSELARQATQTIKHLFMDEQDGYRVLHDWLKAGLLEKNAVAMTYYEPQPKKRQEAELGPMEMLAAEEQGIKFIEAEPVGMGPDGQPRFKAAALVDQPPKFCDSAVPNEEFYCSPDARTITEAALKGRRVRKTMSDLKMMGFDVDPETLAADGADTLLDDARDENRSQMWEDRKGPNRVIWWHEEFARFDDDGDGIAELLFIQRTSDYKVFAIDRMDDIEDHPFEDWCPFPMQHRRIGQSLADKVMDIERIRTVLLRQSLDGIYLSNNPRTYIHQDSIGETTIEDLLTVRPGALVRWAGNVKPETQQDRFDASAGFTMLEFMSTERQTRTGITRMNQGLEADALNKTATETAIMQATGQQMEEYLARNFTNALARLFTKKARLLKVMGQPIMVPIDGEYVQVDPGQWPDDMIARPKVGLGSGRKDQRIMYRRELIGMQTAALEAQATGVIDVPLVDAKTVFASAKGFVNDVGLGDVTEFFNDPSKMPPKPPEQEKPDPEMAKAQAEIAKGQAELQQKHAQFQADQQEAQMRLQMEAQRDQAKLALDREKAQGEAELARAKAQFEAQLARETMAFEQEQARLQMAHEVEMSQYRAASDHEAKMSKNRAGGDLSK